MSNGRGLMSLIDRGMIHSYNAHSLRYVHGWIKMKKRCSGQAGKAEVREYHSPSSGIFFEVGKRLTSEKSDYQEIEVFENDFYGKVLVLDGLIQTTEKDEFFYHEMLVHPALTAHPAPEEVLIIGGGDGGALREVLRHPVRKAWLVEIDARVTAASEKYFWLSGALRDRRTELVIGDGDEFIRWAGPIFDVILVDSSDPVGPSAVLHRRDFYEKVKRCLKPGGVLAAQAGSLLHHLETFKTKHDFQKELFRQARFYLGPVPTYPGGIWVYSFCSDRVDPLRRPKKTPPPGLKYYNADIHAAAFSLPEFLRKSLD